MKRPRKVRRKPILMVVLVLTTAVAFYLFIHSSLFTIKSVFTRGNRVVSSQEIKKLAGIRPGTNIFDFDSRAAARAVLIIPRVKTAEIKRHLPSTVEIKVQERKPWALLVGKGYFALMDDEGVCLESRTSLDMSAWPLITLDNAPPRFRPGQRLDPRSIKALRLIIDRVPAELAKSISEYHCSSDGQLTIYTLDGVEVRVGRPERLHEKMQYFIEAMKLDREDGPGNSLASIDLRFEGQPIVSYKHR